jgi:hypothetical protein
VAVWRAAVSAAFLVLVLAGLSAGTAAAAAGSGARSALPSGQRALARAITRQAVLQPAGAAASDVYGESLVVQGDTALVAAPGRGADTGAVYVYQRSGGTWTEVQQLAAPDAAANSWYGSSLAISGDTVAVGAYGHDASPSAQNGAIYVYVRSGGVWTLQKELVGLDNEQLGGNVALDGDTLLATVQGATPSVRVYVRTGGAWSVEQVLPGTGLVYNFGAALALDGDTAVIGGNGWGDISVPGYAYVFQRSGTVWILQQTLAADDEDGSEDFGYAVAVAGDTVVVGAPEHHPHSAVYTFARTGTAWAQVDRTLSDGTSDRLGYSLALDGDKLLAGAPLHHTGAVPTGGAFMFTRSGAGWTQRAQFTETPVGTGQMGTAVGLSGSAALVSDAGYSYPALYAGVAYAYSLDPVVTGFSPATGMVGATVTVAGSGFSGAMSVTVGGAPAVFAVASDTSLSFVVPGAAPTGVVQVVTPLGTGQSSSSFGVTPHLKRVTPAKGVRGATVTLKGTGFGPRRSGARVRFGSRVCKRYVSWSPTRIKCRVPAKARLGKVRVTVVTTGGQSNRLRFLVKE